MILEKKKSSDFKVPAIPKTLSKSKSSERVVPPSSLLEFNKLVGSLLMPTVAGSALPSSSKHSESIGKFKPRLE